MKKRFIVLVDDATPEQQNAVTLFFKGKFGYYHRFSDSWLLTSSSDLWDSKKIRDVLQGIVAGKNVMVFQVDAAREWAASGTKGMYEWMHTTWTTD